MLKFGGSCQSLQQGIRVAVRIINKFSQNLPRLTCAPRKTSFSQHQVCQSPGYLVSTCTCPENILLQPKIDFNVQPRHDSQPLSNNARFHEFSATTLRLRSCLWWADSDSCPANDVPTHMGTFSYGHLWFVILECNSKFTIAMIEPMLQDIGEPEIA